MTYKPDHVFFQWCSVHDIHAPCPKEDSDQVDNSANTETRPTTHRGNSGLSRLADFLYGGPEPASARDEDDSSSSSSDDDDDAEQRQGGGDNSREDDDDDNQVESALSIIEDGTSGRRTIRIRSESAARRSRQLLDAFIRRRLQEAPAANDEQGREAAQGSAAGGGSNEEEQQPREAPRRGATARDRGIVFFSPDMSLVGGNWVYFGTPREHRRGPAASRAGRPSTSSPPPSNMNLHRNRRRLTHYLEEANTGRGYIKEQCFSPCGRVICSPFGFGLRLLAFSPECSDLSEIYDRSGCGEPRRLVEIGAVAGGQRGGHPDVVLSSCFEPRGYGLVTGCLGGKIVWHQPVL